MQETVNSMSFQYFAELMCLTDNKPIIDYISMMLTEYSDPKAEKKSIFHDKSMLLQSDGFLVRYGQTFGIEEYMNFFLNRLSSNTSKILLVENFEKGKFYR